MEETLIKLILKTWLWSAKSD